MQLPYVRLDNGGQLNWLLSVESYRLYIKFEIKNLVN